MNEVNVKAYEKIDEFATKVVGRNLDFGSVSSLDRKIEEPILLPIVNAFKSKPLVIGGALIVAGVGIIAFGNYKNGAVDYLNAEARALSKLDIFE